MWRHKGDSQKKFVFLSLCFLVSNLKLNSSDVNYYIYKLQSQLITRYLHVLPLPFHSPPRFFSKICTWLDTTIHRLLMYTLYVYASSIDFYPWHLALWLSFLFKIILDLGINQTNVYIQKSQKTFILRIPWLFIPKHIFAMASLIGRQSKNVYKNEHFIRSDFFVII